MATTATSLGVTLGADLSGVSSAFNSACFAYPQCGNTNCPSMDPANLTGCAKCAYSFSTCGSWSFFVNVQIFVVTFAFFLANSFLVLTSHLARSTIGSGSLTGVCDCLSTLLSCVSDQTTCGTGAVYNGLCPVYDAICPNSPWYVERKNRGRKGGRRCEMIITYFFVKPIWPQSLSSCHSTLFSHFPI